VLPFRIQEMGKDQVRAMLGKVSSSYEVRVARAYVFDMRIHLLLFTLA
jgi:hypothetical protein